MWTRSVSLVLFPTHLIALCNNRSTRHNVLPACLPVPVSMSRQDNLGAVKNSHQMLSHSIREVIDRYDRRYICRTMNHSSSKGEEGISVNGPLLTWSRERKVTRLVCFWLEKWMVIRSSFFILIVSPSPLQPLQVKWTNLSTTVGKHTDHVNVWINYRLMIEFQTRLIYHTMSSI